MSLKTFLSTITLLVIYTTLEIANGAPTSNGDLEFIVLHNNDMHARFEQTSVDGNKCKPEDVANDKCYGGFARTAHEIRKFRAEANQTGGTPVLYLNAGDTYTGTPWFTIFKDNITAAFLNLLKPDAISLGNHEFDEGVEGLVPFLQKAEFPVLAANLDLRKTPQLSATKTLKPSKVFRINGVKIGVIGYLTPETKELTIPNDVEFLPEVGEINKEAEVLKKDGVNIIIALGHSGYEMDQKIAKECPDVDLVIGGHSNTFLFNGDAPDAEPVEGPYPTVVKQPNGKEVPVVQAYAYTKYLGHLRLKFNAKGDLIKWDGRPILLNAKIPQDSDFLQLLDVYRPNITSLEKDTIGSTRVELDGNKKSCRKRECNLGNLIADSMVYARMLEYQEMSTTYWTDAAIAIVAGGGIRGSLEKKSNGTITHTDLLTILPFNNDLYMTEVTGRTIRDALELSAVKREETDSDGGFLQVSGIHMVFNISKPFGQRVTNVQVRCAKCSIPVYEDLVDDKTYKIILPLFLLIGGDGHHFSNSSHATEADTKLKMNDVGALAEYIRTRSPIYPGVEWRITIVGSHNPNPQTAGAWHVSMSILLLTFSVLIHLFY